MDPPSVIIWNRVTLPMDPRVPVWLRDFGVGPDGEIWIPAEILEEATGRRLLEQARAEGVPVLAYGGEHEQDNRPFLPLSFVRQRWPVPILVLYEATLRAALDSARNPAASA